MATTTTKTGVTDTAAGTGVNEYLGLTGPLAALLQGVSVIPTGDPWQIKGSVSHTPTLITDILPPSPIMAWKVPSGKSLLFTGGLYHALTAATDYVRVCRRYFLWGYQATAAPAAPAAPTVGLDVASVGIGSNGVYSYKNAPLDTFRREGPLSAASLTATTDATHQVIVVTPPALGTGVIGYNLYRTLVGGSTYYYAGQTSGTQIYRDAQPDASIDTSLTPSNTWTTGAITGETMDGPGEVIGEVGAIAITTIPTTLVYTTPYGTQLAFIPPDGVPSTIGARRRLKLFLETSNFVAVPTVNFNFWRGSLTDARDRHEEDYGVVSMAAAYPVPTAGALMVWGQQVIGSTERAEATAAIKASRIAPINPHGVLIPPLGEIVVEIGALAAGVAAVRDVTVHGLLIPTTGT